MRFLKSLLAFGLGAASLLYLLNPTAGVDLIPDVLPGVGNIDEATATLILLACLRHFGLDLTALGRRRTRNLDADAHGAPPPGDAPRSP